MIEQPLGHDDLLDHAALQKQIATPVCLDESITSLDRARQAIAVGACRYMNIKPGRVGGLTHAVAIHDLCRQHGIPCWVGGMLESAVGAAHCLALATLANFTYPADIFPSSRFYRQDLAEPPIVLSGPSQVRALDRPGIGTTPNPERLARLTVDHQIVLPAG
jgi:O-succinylbenzoate synthase